MIKVYREYLNAALLVAIVLGAICGFFHPSLAPSMKIPGDLFLASLKLLVVPIIFISMLAGMLNINEEESLARIGFKTLVYYTLTTALAVTIGLCLVNLIAPGVSENPLPLPQSLQTTSNSGGLLAVLNNIVPTNIIEAAADGNVLGLIFFTIFLGIALRATKHPGLPEFKNLVDALLQALIFMIDVIMLCAPIGIFALIWSLVGDAVDKQLIATIGSEILRYFITVLLGLLVHGLLSLPLILLLWGINPLKFFKAMLPAVSTAFSTASSAASLPITIDALEKRAKVPNRFASFVAPLGATVNMDGTAIYEAVAAIFIANMYGIALTFDQQFVIFLTATFSAIGAAGIPGAGLVMMTMVLGAVGVPVEGISLIVAVDRILDMFRTSINVWGDSIGAAVIAVSESEEVLTNK